MSSSATHLPTPDGPGSVSQAPNLPAGFADTFTSRYVDTGELRLHAVVGGDGPALLLLAGWPQTWYAWRLLMPALAEDFRVVAVDPRGVGLSGKPSDGYDTATLAGDMVALMAALGHERFAMVGHDVGMWTGYALAADHPDRLDRLAVAEAAIPGLSPSPPMRIAADDVESLIIPDCGHYPAEEAPEEMLAALTAFLAQYRDDHPDHAAHGISDKLSFHHSSRMWPR